MFTSGDDGLGGRDQREMKEAAGGRNKRSGGREVVGEVEFLFLDVTASLPLASSILVELGAPAMSPV
jgi:hypothetical protein